MCLLRWFLTCPAVAAAADSAAAADGAAGAVRMGCGPLSAEGGELHVGHIVSVSP